MSDRLFRTLLSELPAIRGLSGGEARDGGYDFRLSGKSVSLHYDARTDRMRLYAYVDIGRIARTSQREVFRRVLTQNLSLDPEQRAVIGLDGMTDRLVVVVFIALDETLTAGLVAAVLSRVIRKVSAWCDVERSVVSIVRASCAMSRLS